MDSITIGLTEAGGTISLPLRFANRHGLVTGATGTGKTVTLQRLVEGLSAAGVPVFAADIKGDLSGVAAMGDPAGKIAAVARKLGVHFTPDKFPVRLWDLFAQTGTPIRTTVHEIGPVLMSRMLGLNEMQAGALAIAYRYAKDDGERIMDLNALRYTILDMVENREIVSQKYGHVTTAALNVIQRQIFTLDEQGGGLLFGDPVLDITDFIACDDAGRGIINLLDADRLMEAPKLYATFLLWMLTELFRVLPEAGDLEKPILAFFFDEAHLLFKDAPKNLVDMIERLVRLVRSKGVGVYFVTQSPADVPDGVLAQLGNRIQHALRAYTPKDQRMVKASARAFRPNPKIKVEEVITQLAVGEALVSVLMADGVPMPVERVRVLPPAAHVGPLSEVERGMLNEGNPMVAKYPPLDPSIDGKNRSERMFKIRIFTREGLPTDGLPDPDMPLPEWVKQPITNPFGPFEDEEEDFDKNRNDHSRAILEKYESDERKFLIISIGVISLGLFVAFIYYILYYYQIIFSFMFLAFLFWFMFLK
jgi:DNA helicase HerA-like ATPase